MTHSGEKLVFEKVKIGSIDTPGAVPLAKPEEVPEIGATFSDSLASEECESITLDGLMASPSWLSSKLSRSLRAETHDSSAMRIRRELE